MHKKTNAKFVTKMISVFILTLLFASSFFFDAGGPAPAFAEVNTFTDNVGIGTTGPVGLLQAGTSPTPGLLVTAAGKVGIGTTNPSFALDVVGFLRVSEQIRLPSTKAIYLDGGSNTSFSEAASDRITFVAGGTETLHITPGNLGIGTTGPQSLLHVYSSGTSNQKLIQLGNMGTADTFGDIFEVYTNTGNTTKIRARNSLAIYASQTDLTAVPRVFISTGGRVGIGTTDPAYTLDVNGDIYSNGTIYGALASTATVTGLTAGSVVFAGAGGTLAQDNPNLYWNDTDNRLGIGTTGPGNRLTIKSSADNDGIFLVRSGGTENLMRLMQENTDAGRLNLYDGGTIVIDINAHAGSNSYINTGGNVGIGTASPGNRLVVQGTASVNTDRRTLLDLYDDTAFGAGVGPGITFFAKHNTAGNFDNMAYIKGVKENATDGNTSGALALGTRANGGNPTDRLWISSAGNLGIGTTSPGALLDVEGTAVIGSSNGYVANSALTVDGRLAIRGIGTSVVTTSSASEWFLLDTSTGTARFTIANTAERLVISETGNVGIGTTGPSTVLEIRNPAGGSGVVSVLTLSPGHTVGDEGTRIVFNNENGSWKDDAWIQGYRLSSLQRGGIRFYVRDVYNVDPALAMTIESDGTNRNVDIPSGSLTVSGTISEGGTALSSKYAPLSGSSNYVQLQGSTPGTQQTGNLNLSGSGLFNGNVGIGTTNPLATLAVGTNPAQSGVIGIPNAGKIVSRNAAGSGNVDMFWVDSNNKINVGTTLSLNAGLYEVANGTGFKRIDTYVSGEVGFEGGGWATLISGSTINRALVNMGGNIYDTTALYVWNPSTSSTADKIGYGVRINHAGGYTGTNAANYALYIDSITTGTSPYAIYSAGGTNYFGGNVGIGTTGPGKKLEVYGTNAGARPVAKFNIDGTIVGYIGAGETIGGIPNTDFGITSGTSTSSIVLGINGVEKMRVDDNGNVGIGTTGPSTNLQVKGGVIVGSDVVPTSGLFLNSYAAPTHYNWKISTQNTVSGAFEIARSSAVGGTTFDAPYFVLGSDGNLTLTGNVDGRDVSTDGTKLDGITTGAADTTNDTWSGTGNVTMTSGNVGIGTTGPGSLLQVGNNTGSPSIRISKVDAGGEGQLQFAIDGGSVRGALRQDSGESLVLETLQGGHGITIASRQNIDFQTANNDTPAQRMRIDTTGNVGIGTTNPNRLLAIQKDQNAATIVRVRNDTSGTVASSQIVVGQGDSTPYAVFQQSNASYTTDGLLVASSASLWSNGNTSGLRIFTYDATDLTFGTNSAANVTIKSGGNVGIGTTSPAEKLHLWEGSSGGTADGASLMAIEDNTNAYLTFLTPSANKAGILWGDEGSGVIGQIIYNHSDNHMEFTTNTTEQMRITSAGNVGIGTTGPGVKLDVSGGMLRVLSSTIPATGNGTGLEIAYDSGGDLATILAISRPSITYKPLYINGSKLLLNTSSGGNVGIGTTGPGKKLEIAGTSPEIYLNGATSNAIRFNQNGLTNPAIGTLAGEKIILYDSVDAAMDSAIGMSASNAMWFGIADTGGSFKWYAGTNNIMSLTGGGDLSFSGAFSPSTLTVTGATYLATTSGNVGIGTTNPGEALEVSGNFYPTGSIFAKETTGSFNVYGNSSSSNGPGIEMYGDSAGATPGQIRIFSGNGAASAVGVRFLDYNGSGWDDNMVIKNDGNVGIGAASPVRKLEIGGTSPEIYLNGATSNAIRWNTNGVSAPAIGTPAGAKLILYDNVDAAVDLAIGVAGSEMWYSLQSGDHFSWYGGTTEVMRLTGGGNVGIGTTNPSWAKLVTLGSTSEPSLTHQTSAVASWAWNGGVDLALTMSGNSPYTVSLQARHHTVDGGSYPIALNPLGGNVGIGTTGPSAKLEVAGQYFSTKYTTTTTLDWNNANVQYIVLANGAQTFTLSSPKDGGRYILILKQPASGAAGTVTWPDVVLWSGGVAPTLTTTNGKVDVITFVYDGTSSKYYAGSSLNY